MKPLRIVAGVLAWLTAGAALYCWLDEAASTHRDDRRRVANGLWQYATAKQPTVSLELDEAATLAVGDPIFVIDGPDSVRQVGEIRRVVTNDGSSPADGTTNTTAEALFYPTAPTLNGNVQLRYYTTPTSMNWVLQTMLPPDKRLQIAQEITATYQAHHAEIFGALKPVIIEGFYDAMRVVEQDLAVAVKRRRGDLEQLGSRYQEQVVEQEIVPLVRREIWPIVQRHAEPLATQMGQEMWDRASLWRFGWRYVYDKSPLPEQNLTHREWRRFMENDAVPIVESHTADMVAVQQRILADVARNRKVRAAVRHHLAQIIDDPEFQAIVWQIVREALVDNPRLRETLESHWRSAEARQAVALATERIEPCVRRIGELLFGTQDEGITPEFARVLRNQILGKDRRWLVLETSDDNAPLDANSADRMVLRVRRGGKPNLNPFVVQLAGGGR